MASAGVVLTAPLRPRLALRDASECARRQTMLMPALFFTIAIVATDSSQTITRPEIPPQLAAIAAQMRQVHNLRARVQQDKEISVLAETVHNEGTFAFERPRRLVMDFDGVGGTRLVVDGDLMALQYKSLGRTERTQLSHDPRARAVAEHLFLLLDADPEALTAVYNLAVLSAAPLKLRLTPLNPALAKILAHVDADIDARGFVSTLAVVEANGDVTRWRFERVTINTTLPAGIFAMPTP